jgi:hypothetical protein
MVIAIFSLNCTNAKSPMESELEPPTIILGESISGVSIGDDSLSVIAKLGRPTSIAVGDFRGYILAYEKGEYALTYVIISNDPALGLGVRSIIVESPYKGVTEDGIGIGSELSFVISKIGKPNKTSEETPILDTYYYQKNNFCFSYDNGRVFKIIMMFPRRV